MKPARKPKSQSKVRAKTKEAMTGTIAANPHEGSRSEILADYLFTGWGTVTPVRRQDDHGIDLYCTLTERIRKRALVRAYYTVQTKSTMDPVVFASQPSVQWLVEYPQPLFLACVNKSAGVLNVYHLMPRFLVWASGQYPSRIELVPGEGDKGVFPEWSSGGRISLSAPIIRVQLADLLNPSLLGQLRDVFAAWVRWDHENGNLVRAGLLRFRMPYEYAVNQMPGSFGEMGLRSPPELQLRRGVLAAAEAAECIGGQIGHGGDRFGALLAGLFVNHLQRRYPTAFNNQLRWGTGIPADLGKVVCDGLNGLLNGRPPKYRNEGIDAAEGALRKIPQVAAFLRAAGGNATPK